jgi:opacity protein-like surface antigen
MMRSPISLRSAGLAVVLAAGAVVPSFAADMPAPPPPMMPAPMHAPLDVGSGFYLRGDVGLSAHTYDRMHNTPTGANFSTVSSSLEGGPFFGVGAGYQFNSWFRADATLEYRSPARMRYVENDTNPPAGYNVLKGRTSAIVGLANAYVDLGTWHRITPFVGAGVGFASIMTRGWSDAGYAGHAGGSGRAADKTDTRFVWALHAGLGYDLSSNWKAEAGYRYMHIGNVSRGIVCSPGTTVCFNAHIKNMNSHDVKVGLRYLFADAPMAAPIYAPGPLIRKY